MKDTKDETFVALWPLFYSLNKLFNNLETYWSYKTTINLKNTNFLGKIGFLIIRLFVKKMSKYLQKRQQVHLNACLKFPCLAIG